MFKPLHDKVLVRPRDAATQTSGGLFIPPTAEEKSQHGTVIAVGPGRYTEGGTLIKTSVKHGDTVMFDRYAGTEIEIEGAKHLIMSEEQIVGIVES